jgi:hypothetical protein
MDLSASQKSAIQEWVEARVSLSDIQKRLNEAFGLSLTYMEVRFLVDDLDIELKDPEPEPTPAPQNEPSTDSTEPSDEHTAGSITVNVNPINRPGTVMSGDVQFSDGQTAQWQVDQMGRLGLIPAVKGYQPSEDDIHSFQLELQKIFQRKGY